MREVTGAGAGWVPSPRRRLQCKWAALKFSRSRAAPPIDKGTRWSMVTDQRLTRPVAGLR